MPPTWRRPVRHLHARHADGGEPTSSRAIPSRRAGRSKTRWAAFCAAAPAIARSSMRCWTSAERTRQPRHRRAAAVGARLQRSTASPSSTARRSSAPMRRPQARCGSGDTVAPCARPLQASAISRQFRTGTASTGADHAATCRSTASASIRPSRISRCSPRTRCAIAAMPCWRWSASRTPSSSVAERDVPIRWQPLDPVSFVADARRAGRRRSMRRIADNVLVRGRVVKGDVDGDARRGPQRRRSRSKPRSSSMPISSPRRVMRGRSATASRSPPAPRRPYMDRDEVAHVMGISKSSVRIMPTATGGGFGGKLDHFGAAAPGGGRDEAPSGRCAASTPARNP